MEGTNFVKHLEEFIGETVTIFTTSGGESGSGFTGVLLAVNNCFVRLIAQIGTAPGCALGNCCDRHERDRRDGRGDIGGLDDGFRGGCQGERDRDDEGRFTCRGNRVGAVVDIPVDRIASFVHNAV